MKIRRLIYTNLIIVLIAGMTFTSCKKDKNSSDNLVGTWTAGTPSFTAMVGTRTLTQYFTEVMGLNATQIQQFTLLVNQQIVQTFSGTITIKSDNTYTSNMGGSADSGTWSLSSDGTKLTIDSNTSTPDTFDVVSLTSNTMKLKFTDTESEDLNSDGTPEILTLSVDLTFTR